MSDELLSASWYRVAPLRPSLRGHARFHRHRYRGQLWYVLHDPASGRSHRLTPAAYRLTGFMDGQRTTHQIWELICTQLGDAAPTQDETIRILGMLHSADLLRCDVTPDTLELFRRTERRASGEHWRRYANPLSFRLPLLDPDELLERGLPWVRPLFTRTTLLVWALVVGSALVLTGVHWSEITQGATRELLDPRNLLLIWFVYPVVKALHELGHAFATKMWGGEVHETGFLFLVFMPMPYVDASASAVFPEKWRRAAVGAAGILVELFLASLALFVWLAVEPGWIRSIAYNVMWIGGVSTLLFNGNPLLRFDGYYVMCDAVEIPNLSSRATQYLKHLALRHLFGLEHVREPVATRGEKRWFVAYGLAASVYRVAIMVGIALFVAGRFFVVGVCLALLSVTTQVLLPLVRFVGFLLTSPRLGEQRPRALAVSAGLAAGLGAVLLLLPAPLFTHAEGVVWPREGSEVRARADGFVLQLLVPPGTEVETGEPLVLTRDPSLEAELAVLEARLLELRARRHAERRNDRVQAENTLDEIHTAEAELAQLREQVGEVLMRSPVDGRFVAARAEDLVGRFVRQGDTIGWVMAPTVATARVVIPQSDAALVRERTRGVEVRLSRRIGAALSARVEREVPAATDQLPSSALGATGGGRFAVDPSDTEGLRTLESIFQLDVSLPKHAAAREIGGRVYVRFDHGFEPLALRGYRAARRLLLRQLGV